MLQDEPSKPWQTLDVSRPLQFRRIAIRQDRVRTHHGAEYTFVFVEHPGSVVIVPLTDDGRIVLLRQYRYVIDAWSWEVPAGYIDTTVENTVVQELAEEIGGTSREQRLIASFYTSNGMSNEQVHAYLALGVELGATAHEETELMYQVLLPFETVIGMARNGEITDAPSALAILLSAPHIEAYMAAARAERAND